jgi:glutamate synthase domain-containing protein 3
MTTAVEEVKRRGKTKQPPASAEDELPSPSGIRKRQKVRLPTPARSTATQQLKGVVGDGVAEPKDEEDPGKVDNKVWNQLGEVLGTINFSTGVLALEQMEAVQETFDEKKINPKGLNQATLQAFIDHWLLQSVRRYSDSFPCEIGLLMTAALERTTAHEIRLNFREHPPTYLCCFFKSDKEVTVEGDVGDYLAVGAEKGRIIVEQNSGIMTAFKLNGAYVEVKGTARTGTAGGATKGTVIVDGETVFKK